MTSVSEGRTVEATATRRRRLSFVAPVVILVAALAVLGLRSTVWRDDRPGGDDDRRLLKALAAEVPAALPPGARVVERYDFPAYWDGCARVEELSGWQPVRVLVRLDLPSATKDDVDRHLAAAGWSNPGPPGWNPDAPGWWVRTLSNGTEARLIVTGAPPAASFIFTAQPPGPQPRGC